MIYRSFLLLSLLLLGCAGTPPAPQPIVRPAQAGLLPFVLNGRIVVRHNGDISSADMHWTHSNALDEILLLAPLGQTVARINRSVRGVELDTSDKHYTAEDTGELTRRVLGWRLPLEGLRYWVLALPDPESRSVVERDANGQVSVMRQDGWVIRYTRYTAQTPDSLPLRMNLQREGAEIQLLVNEWEI